MGFIGELIDRIVRRFARRTADKVADKAADKVAGVAADKINKKVDEEVAKNGSNEVQGVVDQAASEATTGQDKLAAAVARAAVANNSAAKADMKNVNEVMGYFNFGPGMEIVGVKDDAPEWVKVAYQNGEFDK
ncbi:MAG: hypothetical protein MJZ37_06095 [Bacilli bacterium]|nr:hypothetical protein [Bacilli bacterium]